MSGEAISMFLLDGVADGRVVCELFNWNKSREEGRALTMATDVFTLVYDLQ
jgi:hypothetical protein